MILADQAATRGAVEGEGSTEDRLGSLVVRRPSRKWQTRAGLPTAVPF